jgi:serine/threonine protein kinase/Tfp pilus assembly protein PilF
MPIPEDSAPPSTEVSSVEAQLAPPASPRDAGADRLAIGAKLSGRYRIERELGTGGMGIVYLAVDEQVAGEIFAVKVLKEDLRPEALELLREEVRKTRKLSHPNVVDVHSVNVDGTRLYVLMEYLEGKPLNALLDEEFGRGMPFSHAWPIIEDVCAALGYAHDRSIVHSDLKPANIFVTTSGRTKLLDLGIARVSRGPLLHRRSGFLALTPEYASCEMLEGKEADRRDDIFSFACVIYEMLSGERPFGERTALEARTAKVQVLPIGVLSRHQNEALIKALTFDRTARTGSVEQLLVGLAPAHESGSRQNAILAGALIATVAALGLGYLAFEKISSSRRAVVVEAVAPAAQPAPVSPKSIVVVPLLDLSRGHGQQYIADGLTTALIDRLTLFPGMSVTGQTSSFAVKDSKEDAPTLARRLRVEYLLEGTLRGSGEQLRVSVRLLRGADGFELWSQAFDRSGGEILKLEDDIARAVVADLHGGLVDMQAPTVPSTNSFEAFRLRLQALQLWGQEAGTDAERALIEAALQKDPRYVDAWVDLGTWWYDSMLLGKVAPQTAVPSARAAYDRALAIDENSSDLYIGMAWLQMSQLDWTGAQRSIGRANALNPESLLLLTVRGELARSAGQWAEAQRLEHERLQRDPLSVATMAVLAQSQLCAGDYRSAADTARQALLEGPKFPGVHALLARALAAQGEGASALKVIEVESEESLRLAELAGVQSDLGHTEAYSAALSQLRTRYGETLPGLVGLVYAQRKELDPAFQWLQRAVDRRQPEFAANVACTPEPAFNALHADPRYAALRSRLGFNH